MSKQTYKEAFKTNVIDHSKRVAVLYYWMLREFPDIHNKVKNSRLDMVPETSIDFHDSEKLGKFEFEAYADYRSNKNIFSKRTYDSYNYAKLHHRHTSPHHWQYWVYIDEFAHLKPLPIPMRYIVEMVADWFSYGIAIDRPYEIFEWYVRHEDTIELAHETRREVEHILALLHNKLDSLAMETDVSSYLTNLTNKFSEIPSYVSLANISPVAVLSATPTPQATTTDPSVASNQKAD